MRPLIQSILMLLTVAALTTTIAQAEEVPPTLGTSVINADATPPVEVIPKTYVSVNPISKNKTIISILQTLNEMTLFTKNKVHSLLNWEINQRPNHLEVSSYNRIEHFGKWVKNRKDQSCLNTRAKVLVRDSKKSIIFNSENTCSVEKGEWADPYAGKILTDAIAEVQIDHMVPLKNAYISGAHSWDYKARCLYGNYLGLSTHLIPVLGSENQKKSDKSPEGYMPPNKSYACVYLKNWLTIKSLWNLEMTVSEAQAIKTLIQSEGCKAEDLVISEAEIKAQRKFAFENSDLCSEKNIYSN